MSLSLILFSWVAMLASYTVLPTRATIPPMMSLSTFVVIETRLPVSAASLFSMAPVYSSDRGSALVTSARTMF